MNLSVTLSVAYDVALTPEAVRVAAGVERVGDLRDRHLREVHELDTLACAASDQPRELSRFADTLRESLRQKERLWVFIAGRNQIHALKQWLPSGVDLIEIGPEQRARGRDVLPVGIIPTHLALALAKSSNLTHQALAREACQGLDGLCLPYDLQMALTKRGIRVLERNRLTRLVTNPRFLAYVVVLVYSALRALPVTFVKQFHGSILVLWTIDLATAIPYTWGILAMVTAAKWRTRMLGLTVAIVTFVAPYVYFAVNGSDYPPSVLAIIAGLIVTTLLLEGVKWWLDRKVSRQLQRAGVA